MNRRVKILRAWAALIFWAGTAAAEDQVFISVTREAAPLSRMPTNVSVLTAEQIEESRAQTLDEVLDILPSVDVNKTGTIGSFSTVRLRGVPSSGQVQILVDDQPLGGVSTQFVDLSQIPVDNIERIEVVRGGSSVLYGANSMGGVIHIITKRHKAEKPTSSIGAEGRSYKTQIYQADLGLGGHGFDGYIYGQRYFTDGFQKNSDGDNVTVTGNGGYSWDNGARVSFDFSRADHSVGNPLGTAVPLEEWDGSRERDPLSMTQRVEQDTNMGRLKVGLPLGGAIHFQSSFYGSDQNYLLLASPNGIPIADFENQIVGNDTRLSLPGGVSLGGSYERDERIPVGSPAHHIVNWGTYLQDTVTAGNLTLLPAVRLDQHSAFGNTVNPRLSVVYNAEDDWKISANAGRSFRAPTIAQLYENFPEEPPFSGPFLGNPDLKPETAWTYDLGLSHQMSSQAQATVTGFYTRIRDRIYGTSDPYPASNTVKNGPEAEISGAEFEMSTRVDFIDAVLNYTYQRAIGNNATSTEFVPLAFTPRHKANLSLIAHWSPGWRLTNTVQYVDKQYAVDNEQGIKLPSYTVWNIRLARKILAAELFFAVNNVTNKHYADSVSFGSFLVPQPPRNYAGGLTIRFQD